MWPQAANAAAKRLPTCGAGCAAFWGAERRKSSIADCSISALWTQIAAEPGPRSRHEDNRASAAAAHFKYLRDLRVKQR